MVEGENINFQFKFKEIKTLRFFVDNRSDAIRDISTEGYKIQIGGANFIGIKDEILGFDIIAEIFTNDENNIKVCEFINRISFNVKNIKKFAVIKDKEVSIQKTVLSHLFALAISTARGSLHEKLRGSIVEGFILPPVNIQEIISNMQSSPKT